MEASFETVLDVPVPVDDRALDMAFRETDMHLPQISVQLRLVAILFYGCEPRNFCHDWQRNCVRDRMYLPLDDTSYDTETIVKMLSVSTGKVKSDSDVVAIRSASTDFVCGHTGNSFNDVIVTWYPGELG